jgi:hypothetical protein
MIHHEVEIAGVPAAEQRTHAVRPLREPRSEPRASYVASVSPGVCRRTIPFQKPSAAPDWRT